MTVNNFRKTTKNEEVITLSKSLIKIWKKLLSGTYMHVISDLSYIELQFFGDGDKTGLPPPRCYLVMKF